VFSAFNWRGNLVVGPTRVNPEPGSATAWRGSPPSIALGPNGSIYVAWTARSQTAGYNGGLFISMSTNRGRNFESPVKMNYGSSVAAGMQSLAVADDGAIFVEWLGEGLDGAESNITKKIGAKAVHGASNDHKQMARADQYPAEATRQVLLAVSRDGGQTFSEGLVLTNNACPCCKTALATGPDGHVYASWREVLAGDHRHIAVATSQDGGKSFSQPGIVSDDQWLISGCPVSGATISVGPNGNAQVLWYSGGEAGPSGLYFAESKDAGKSFTPRRLISEGSVTGTPILLTDSRGNLNAIWQGEHEQRPALMAAVIRAKGAIAEPIVVAEGGKLPAAAVTNNDLFVVYGLGEARDRALWLARAVL
jgi:hypothetical protein